ncbi:EamA family transporter [Glaciihabitans sp. INWT7]|uniref:EamA family transporter n=1 Tax=Glaciihabitans sp. INWT7 TaxID=2596912 RepID=UPI00162824ED|nr:EamA family transporter [Glaciihabitans sp. INWT7]QNE45517.1 EamA family transporter [Glaciihabitans sp. INWT7]
MTAAPVPRPAARPFGAVGLVAAGLICQEVGASFAVLLFPSVGAIGMVSLRLAFSAIVLLAIARPRLRGHSRNHWLTVIAFGLALALMNALFYEALARVPLGATITIEVLGPLVLSVVMSRRASSWLWAVLAFAGVVILSQGSFGDLDPVGVAFAFGAATMWAAYILLSARTGARFPRLDGLAIAMTVGAVVTVPFGIATAGPVIFQPGILLLGAAVALLSSTIPYALELVALRRLPSATFSILMSLSPAIATTAGFLILGQTFTGLAFLAIGLVIAASIGAVLSASRAARGGLPDTGIGEPLS